MKKTFLLIAVILMSTAGMVQAQEEQLGVTMDVTYLSRYIWRGFDLATDNHSAIQPSIDLDLWGTGFGLNIWYTQSNQHVEDQELDFTLSYGDTFCEGQSCVTDYKLGWMYYSYPDAPRNRYNGSTTLGGKDAQEIFASFSWPEICPMGIVPSYTYIYMWQADGGNGSNFRKAEGAIHVLSLGYDVAVSAILPDTTEQVINLSAAATYNDGTGGATVEHDWSHIVWGASTKVPLAENLTFTPGLFYQTSMEDTVNTEDEYWTSLSLTYTF